MIFSPASPTSSALAADSSAEVTGLIAYSAQQASGKLQAYRMAYGAGGMLAKALKTKT